MSKFPIVAITGPRQAGKTTLCRMLKPEYKYVNLEDISAREFAKSDPKGFLETYQNGVIIDEIQYVPELTSSFGGMFPIMKWTSSLKGDSNSWP